MFLQIKFSEEKDGNDFESRKRKERRDRIKNHSAL